MAPKCRISCKYTILPLTILIIILFQLYFQYSTFMTKRYQDLETRDKRNQIYTLNFIGKRYDFNLKEIDNYFNDNALMKINILKDVILNGFNKWNESRKNKLDKQIYELLYLIIYDLIFLFFLYKFIFKSVKAGIAKIIIQILKCIFTGIRIKKKNQGLCFYNIIHNHFENSYFRNSEIFTPEGFENFEFLCNLVVILDIIWLIIIKKESRKNNNYNLTETELGIKKQVLTDENRVDYKEENVIELKEEKNFSNEGDKENDGGKDDDKDDNNNINNKDDDDNDNNNNNNQNDSYNQNEKENDKDDEEINNNKYDEDNEDINNNKDEDDDQDNNCESNENNYNNYKNSEVNNSFKDNEEKEDEKNNEEENVLDVNQETT